MDPFTVSFKEIKENSLTSHFHQQQIEQRGQYFSFFSRQPSLQQKPDKLSSQQIIGVKQKTNSQLLNSCKCVRLEQKVRKPFFSNRPSMDIVNTTKRESKNIDKAFFGRQRANTKIVFSYENVEPEKGKGNVLSQNYRQQRVQQIIQKGEIFSLHVTKNKNENKAKKLNICSAQYNYVILPQGFLRKAKKSSCNNRARSASIENNMYNCSLSTPKNKESKIASTKASLSFGTENGFSDVTIASNTKINQEPKQNTSEITDFSLLNNLPPSKMLKNTMVISKYDFGGIIDNETASCEKQAEKITQNYQKNRWQICVKGLFEDNENLKNSIHCGPDIRVKSDQRQILLGFGRQIGSSCFPDQEKFQ